MKAANRRPEYLLTFPSLGWLIMFFGIPTMIIFVLALKRSDATGGVAPGWTLDHLCALLEPQYRPVIWRTLWISAATASFCLLLALPAALGLTRCSPRWRNLLMLLVIAPFWTSFLIRIFAWRTLLQSGGLVSRLVEASGFFAESPALLYNNGAVVFIMIYTQLPFAILPLYAAMEKFDFTLLQAARDLGATRLRSLTRVFLPGIARGIFAAGGMVFIATIGMYVVPDIIGGVDAEMIGNKIAQRVGGDRNLPLASALAAALLGGVILLLLAAWRSTFRSSGKLQSALERGHTI